MASGCPPDGMIGPRPLVSVITISLNAERFIREAIESVFAQTYEDWELVLVDDGSHDGTPAIARDHAARHPGRVRYLEHESHRNLGMSASRNVGVTAARGELVLFLDSDDVLLPHALAEQVAALTSHPAASMVCGSGEYWHSWTGREEDAAKDFEMYLRVRPDVVISPPRFLLLCDPLGDVPSPCLCSVMIRREAALRVGGFEEEFRDLCEDQAFLVKMYLRESVVVVDRCWSRYRQHEDSCCAVMRRAGGHKPARRRLLEWLWRYLSAQSVRDPAIWQAVERVLRPYRGPIASRLWAATGGRVARRMIGMRPPLRRPSRVDM